MYKIWQFVKKTVKIRKYTNFVDASRWSRLIRLLTGSALHDIHVNSSNQPEIRLSVVGCVFFFLWNALYIFCAYTAQAEDQTILRKLYSTKMQRYGDDFERISSFIYVMFTMWLIPIRLSFNVHLLEIMLRLDKIITDVGDYIDYNGYARKTVFITFGQLSVYIIRMICIWFPISNSEVKIPYEKIFQVVYSDAQAIILTSLYCYFNVTLRDRYKWINQVLKDIEKRSSWEYKVFSRGKITPNIVKVISIQERYICEKIKTCARVYSMLYNVCGIMNKLFGFAILLTLFHYLNYIILYLYYFMEATASGLFHDVHRYFDFCMYSFWEIAIALGIMFLNIHFCESVMKEAKYTSYILHEIINGDFSEDVNTEAMQLSLQLLHEQPTFSALGLFELNYALLQQGARSVSTYLVILLQFATENEQYIRDI